jgi:four helix bundle protein
MAWRVRFLRRHGTQTRRIANLREGQGVLARGKQGTDRAFANYLTHSKGSLAEAVKWLKKAYFKKYITQTELDTLLAKGEELAKMLGGFIKYCAGATGKTAAPTERMSS